MTKIRTHVFLEGADLEKIKKIAAKNKWSVSEVIRQALAQWFKRK